MNRGKNINKVVDTKVQFWTKIYAKHHIIIVPEK